MRITVPLLVVSTEPTIGQLQQMANMKYGPSKGSRSRFLPLGARIDFCFLWTGHASCLPFVGVDQSLVWLAHSRSGSVSPKLHEQFCSTQFTRCCPRFCRTKFFPEKIPSFGIFSKFLSEKMFFLTKIGWDLRGKKFFPEMEHVDLGNKEVHRKFVFTVLFSFPDQALSSKQNCFTCNCHRDAP